MGMKLDQDYTINGHHFAKGDDVNTVVVENDENGKPQKVDYADSLKELMGTTAKASDYAKTHKGESPYATDQATDSAKAEDNTDTKK